MVEINPDAAPIVKEIFNLYVLERESISGIVLEFNRRGIPPLVEQFWQPGLIFRIFFKDRVEDVFGQSRNCVLTSRFLFPSRMFLSWLNQSTR